VPVLRRASRNIRAEKITSVADHDRPPVLELGLAHGPGAAGRAAAQRFYRQLELVAGFSRQITLENTYRSALVANNAAKTGIVRGAPVSIATGRGKLRNAPKATAGRQNVARRDVPISAVSRCSKILTRSPRRRATQRQLEEWPVRCHSHLEKSLFAPVTKVTGLGSCGSRLSWLWGEGVPSRVARGAPNSAAAARDDLAPAYPTLNM
jgi:hypothetical protein